MSKRDSILVIIASFLALLVMYVMANNIKKEYISNHEDIQNFQKEAKSLGKLKRKFNKDSYEKTIKSLNRISHVTSDIKKADTRILVYENLSASSLSNMLRKIENSTLLIKKLDITRISEQNANLRLEISK
jgi:hypothetical protein